MMNVQSLNLFASIAMVLTCIIGIVRSPPAFHRFNFTPFRKKVALNNTTTASLSYTATSYPMRYCTTDAEGNSYYFRFTIARAGNGYRVYLDSAPCFNRSLEELGLKQDNNRYYIVAGNNLAAEVCENVARNWVNSHVNDLQRLS